MIRRRPHISRALLALGLLAAAAPLSAQAPVPPAEYGRWENLGGATLSPGGDWIAYGVSRVDGENELRIRDLSEDETRAVAWGQGPTFSPDGRWLAWSVGHSPDARENASPDEPLRNSVTLLDLETGGERSFDAVRSFRFDAQGAFIALHGYVPDEPEGKGADVRLLDLGSGVETSFGNVSELAWSDVGSHLAMAIATGEDAANGVQVYDAADGRIQSLDTSGSAYRQLSWRADATDLAVLKSTAMASEDEPGHALLAWIGVGSAAPEARRLQPSGGGPHDIVRHRRPEWSDDGRKLSLGLRPAEDDPNEPDEAAASDETSPEDDAGEEEGVEEASEEEPDLPTLQIWHSGDVRIYPQQKAAEANDDRRTLLTVWDHSNDNLVIVSQDLMGSSRILEGWTHALEDISEPYPWGNMFGRPYHDVWRVDLATGQREKVLERVRYEWPSAGGGYVVTFDGENYASLNVRTGESVDLTSDLPTVFANVEYDTPTDMLPPHTFAPSFLEGDAGVLLADDHDLWRVALDGSGGTRLTSGADERTTHRVAFMADDDVPGLDPDAPIYLTLHGEWSEKRGYARAMPDGTTERLVFEDQMMTGLAKADSADVYVYRAMAFDDPPDHFVAGSRLADARRVTEINPFFDEYAWGRSEVIDFTSTEGRDLQAVLYYPADYVEGTPVPTIVYTYEMRSQTVHNFQSPSERSYYNFTAWTQHGYAVLQPDIVYTAREPGVSALAAVTGAVNKVVELGITDPDAVGLIGHSWGGYQATYLPTRTDLFAASVAGAPLTDFVSFMGQIHWNPGLPELSHWETGQGRMEVPFWEDPDAHRRNSPIHKVHEMETPLLMATGDDDGVVDWDQATEFYNFARRAGKQMVLLVYEGEDHGFSEEANQKDYHRRILEWFGHYLKGDPAPAWITDGVRLDNLEEEKRRLARGGS